MAVVILVPADESTIQAGIDSASIGDTVLVSPGTYTENIDFGGKAILVVGEWGTDSTAIRPANQGLPIVRFATDEDSNSIIDGFDIGGISGSPGIQCSNSGPTIRNCAISFCLGTGAPADDGRGIDCVDCSARIRNNRIHHNTSKDGGGGIYLQNPVDVEISHNDIYKNDSYFLNATGEATGIKVLNPSGPVTIERNLIRGNRGNAIEISGEHITIINNTVVDNMYGLVYAGICEPCNVEMLNNIFAFNRAGGFYLEAEYTNVWPDECGANYPGPNGILADPVLADPASGDYSLDGTSPCIDAGHPDAIYNDSDGTRNDMGAGPFTGVPHDTLELCPRLNTGDVNHSGAVTSADVIYLVNHVFKGGCGPVLCDAVGDVNCSGAVSSADIIGIVNHLFRRWPMCDVCTVIPSVWSCP